MITVHNINEYTLQQVYDQIAAHLLQQGKRCRDYMGVRCRLRDNEGLACAIGSLIPEDDYTPRLERFYYVEMFYECFNLVLDDQMENLLELFRCAHDSYQPSEWPTCLHDIAEKMNLSSEVVSCFTH